MLNINKYLSTAGNIKCITEIRRTRQAALKYVGQTFEDGAAKPMNQVCTTTTWVC